MASKTMTLVTQGFPLGIDRLNFIFSSYVPNVTSVSSTRTYDSAVNLMTTVLVYDDATAVSEQYLALFLQPQITIASLTDV